MLKLLSALVIAGWFSVAGAAPELTVTIGHTSHDTLAFVREAKMTSLTMTVAGSARTKVVAAKNYSAWLERFRSLRKRGLALKDHRPSCALRVKFQDNARAPVNVCYERNQKLDREVAALWLEVRAKIGER